MRHAERGRDHIGAFGGILTDLVKRAATAGAGLGFDIHDLLDPFKMRGQRTAVGLTHTITARPSGLRPLAASASAVAASSAFPRTRESRCYMSLLASGDRSVAARARARMVRNRLTDVLFDLRGVCRARFGLCAITNRLASKWDRNGTMHFLPSQSIMFTMGKARNAGGE